MSFEAAGQFLSVVGGGIALAYSLLFLARHQRGGYMPLRLMLGGVCFLGAGSIAYFSVARGDSLGLAIPFGLLLVTWPMSRQLQHLIDEEHEDGRHLHERLVPVLVAFCGFIYLVSRL